MKPTLGPDALFYPFHLCHQETLGRLLRRFRAVHFRDFMALHLTPMTGLTAYPDRMGDSNPELLASGRIVQGYDVSGSLPEEVAAAVDRDLADPRWRDLFQAALRSDGRFRAGLGQDERQRFNVERHATTSYTLARIKRLLSRAGPDGSDVAYGVTLIKTSAALAYTLRLARAHQLQPATDSPAHFGLLERSCRREHIHLSNHLILRQGY